MAHTISAPRLSGVVPGADETRGLLTAAASHRREADAHEAAILDIAARWADAHPPEADRLAGVPGSRAMAATFSSPAGEEPISGAGTPSTPT